MKRAIEQILMMGGAAALIGCADNSVTDPRPRSSELQPSSVISDAVHSSGKPHFYFLPPMVSNPTTAGTFDPVLSPSVQICVMSAATCATTMASYSMTSGSDGERVTLTDGQYQVNWHTDVFNLDATKTYRITVLVGDVTLGYADVDVVESGKELRNVNTNEYIPLLDGRTLPIKFRVESGFLSRIDVVPLASTIGVGNTQQYIANLYDLHGAALTGIPVTWASNNTAVANVNQSGLATAASDGQATISAAAAGVMGSATLTVRGGVVTTSAGYFHTCALATTGGTHCWGYNSDGQLGVSTLGFFATPQAVSGGHSFISLAIGYLHSCGLQTDGSVWCWGEGGYGTLGQSAFASSSLPVQVGGGHTFRSITAGAYYTCGLDLGGAAFCWGYNGYGSLGTGDNVNHSTPTAVTGGYTFKVLDAGTFHACGLTTANQLICWGYNFQGQLGIGTFNNAVPPYAVANPTPVIGGHTFASIGVYGFNTCGLEASGAAYCWGYNAAGGVGNGTYGSDVNTPTAVSGGLNFTELFTGLSYHVCARATSGDVYCWGYNGFGGLGLGFASWSVPTPTLVSGGDQWATITTGIYHTCGITTSGAAKCWGYGAYGQLGTGNFSNVSVPTPVLGGLTFATP